MKCLNELTSILHCTMYMHIHKAHREKISEIDMEHIKQ